MMATGYTADVVRGEVTEFRDFALRCARGMGALVLMRDEPFDAEIPEQLPVSDYHDKALAEAQSRLDLLRWMTAAEMESWGSGQIAEMIAYHEEEMRARMEERERALRMREQVAGWEPPTPDHEGMKKFMLQQLDVTLEHDGTAFHAEELEKLRAMTPREWWAAKFSEAASSIVYHREEGVKERERHAQRQAWLDALRKSLEVSS